MKLAVAAIIGLTTTLALAKPKGPPPGKLQAAAREAFADATAANDAGKLDEAERLYTKALELHQHPNTQYNLAEILHRKMDIQGAIDAYRKYLVMDPAAQDRADVEKLIAKLERVPAIMVLDVEESDAQIFVDGEPVARTTPFEIELPPGEHTVDVVTPVTHGHEYCQVERGRKETCSPRPKPRVDGNLIISGPRSLPGSSFGPYERTTFQERHPVTPGIRWAATNRNQNCKALKVAVASGDVVTYYWVDVREKPYGDAGCFTIKSRRVLTF